MQMDGGCADERRQIKSYLVILQMRVGVRGNEM